MLTLNDGRTELWQWDTGRKLSVDADCSQVHFSNKVFGRSVDVDVVDGVAIVPDILLQTDKELTAWAFVGTPENGYTKISKVFRVNRRNKPADYVFTPPERTTLEELVERLDKIEESQDPDAIKNAVDEYLANNPIQVEEKDPTVPDWAKRPTKPKYTADEVGAVATVNGTAPDENGNVEIEIPEVSEPDMTGYATERYVQENYQPKGNYLTEIPEGYAKTEDIPAKPEDIGAQPAGNYLTEVPEGYATKEFVTNKIAEAELGGEEVDLSGYAQKSELPTKVSQLVNDTGYLTGYTETDPTVPAWAKAANKPNYSKAEVGLGNVENVKQYSDSNPPPYPVKSVNGKTGAVTLNAAAVGADPAGTASTAVLAHNADTDAHSDLRLELKVISDRLNAFFDSDDSTLDELSEIVAYITSNKTLIDSITTSKVNVSDIINNLTTNVSSKPLSAAQGVILKGLIDALSSGLSNYALKSSLPTKVSQLTNDSGFLTDYTETDPTVPAWAKAASKPSYSKSEVGLGNLDNVKQYSASNPPPYPVTSVNGKTGAVKLDVDVTADKVEAALGYVPADSETVLLSDDLLQETEYTIAPYTNMIDRYGSMARTQLNRNGGVSEATWNVWVTNYIPIRKGQKLHIKFKDGATFGSGMMFALYDSNKTLHDDYHIAIYLSAITANPTVYGTLSINGNYAIWDTSTIGYGGWSGFAYARIMYESSDCVITVDEEITDNVETVYELKPTITVPKNNLSFDVAEKPLVGKRVVCFGDSFFGQTRDETSALHHTAQITGADLYNVGFGGTSAAKVGSGAFAQFSLPALTDAIISGTWTSQDNNVSAATGWDEQLPKLQGINFSAVDIIVLHYGTNDFMSAYALEGTAVTTVCGGLRYSIEKILTKYPQIKFFISVPCFRYWGSAGAYTYPDTYTNSNGAKLTDFVEGIRKVAAEYNFPVIDSFYGMGVNKFNAAHYLADQTHHSVAGRKLFGEFIAAQITSQQSVAKSGIDTEAVQSMIDAAIAAIPVYNGEVV